MAAENPQVRALARRLQKLEKQALLRKQPTLGFSSIDDGAITSVDEDGVLKMILGKQFDGTQTSAVVSGPTPPQPLMPYLTPQPGAMKVYWDGTFTGGAVAPMDFARVLAYAVPLADFTGTEPLNQAIIVGQFTSAVGGEVSVVLDPSTEYAVYFVAWTEAGKFSAASDVAVATTLAPLQGEPGEDGADGLPGPPGEDGESLYTWLKYADDASGTGLQDSPVGKTYIGLAYNKPTATESTDPADYTWALIKGADGEDGADGVPGSPGEDGADGQSLFTWVKYADTPTTGMSDDPTGKTYIGLAYNKTTPTESTTPGDYQWSLFKGADGADGDDGVPGPPGNDGQSLYTWVKYADSATGSGLTDDPTGKDFIGLAYNKTTATESTVPADYQWSRYRGNDEPVVAPGSSPEIRVTGTTSSLIVETDPIDAGTVLDYYVSETEDFTPDSDSLYITGSPATIAVLQTLADGTPFDPAGTYYVKVIARNDIGSASESNQVIGTLNMDNVDSVVTATLVAGFILTGQIQVGQILIDAASGISINQPGGGYILNFPSNGVDPLELTAQIVAQSLNVEDNLSIGGNGQLYGDFQMTNGITNPSSQPSLGNQYPSTLMENALGDGGTDISNVYHGMTEGPADANHVAVAFAFFGAGIRIMNKYSGVVGAYPDPTDGKGWCENFYPFGGITYMSGYYYVFGQDLDRPVDFTTNECYLYKIDASTFNKVAEIQLWNTGTFGDYKPALGNDGSNIFIFWVNSNKNLRFRSVPPNLSSWSSTTALMDLSSRRSLADVHYAANIDGIGSARWWVAQDGGNDPVYCWTANSSGPNSRSAAYDFEKATNGMMAMTYDTQRGQMISLDRYGYMYRYGKYPTDQDVVGKFAWLDDNATGGTHETIPGPSKTQTIKARSYVNMTVGSPPDLNNDDALNTDKANKVAGYFSTDGGSTWRRRVFQKDRTATITTSNDGDLIGGSFTEQDIGSTVTATGVPSGAKIKHFISGTQVRIDKTATATASVSAVIAPGNPWSTAYSNLTDLSTGTPKTSNEFLSSTVQTPGKIRSTAADSGVDGLVEKIHLKGDGQFRLGNLTHVRHYGSRKMTGSQNISSGGSPTIVNFGSTKETETGVTWDGGNSRWIINKPGVYMVSLAIQWSNSATSNRRHAMIFKNGSEYASNESPGVSFDTSAANQVVSVPIPCVAGDYIDARVFQNSGSTLAINDKTDQTRHYFSISFVQT